MLFRSRLKAEGRMLAVGRCRLEAVFCFEGSQMAVWEVGLELPDNSLAQSSLPPGPGCSVVKGAKWIFLLKFQCCTIWLFTLFTKTSETFVLL